MPNNFTQYFTIFECSLQTSFDNSLEGQKIITDNFGPNMNIFNDIGQYSTILVDILQYWTILDNIRRYLTIFDEVLSIFNNIG